VAVFLSDGRIEIDQNLCENAMRPVALGRKNWLHIGSEKAAPKIAAILSIFETCKRHRINLRVHHSKPFKEWVAQHSEAIELASDILTSEGEREEGEEKQ